MAGQDNNRVSQFYISIVITKLTIIRSDDKGGSQVGLSVSGSSFHP